MPYPCYPALAEGEFGKCPLRPLICLLCIAWLPDVFSHPVFSCELEFRKVVKFCLYKSGPPGSTERSSEFLFGERPLFQSNKPTIILFLGFRLLS